MINVNVEEPARYSMEEKIEFLEEQAKRMRMNPTEGELRFKDFCDRYGIRYEFQKTLTIGWKGFILDFSIITKQNTRYKNSKKRKIDVEIDGPYHNTKEQQEKDAARSKTLNGARYKVLRLTNEETMVDAIIIRKLKDFCCKINETELYRKLDKIAS